MKAETLYTRLLDSKDQLIAMPGPVVARIMRKLGTTQRLHADGVRARQTFEKLLELIKNDISQGKGMKPVLLTCWPNER